MNRSIFLGAILACSIAQAAPESDAEIHRRAIVVDTHADTTQAIVKGKNIGQPQPELNVDLSKMKAGGLDAQFFSIWVNPYETKPEDYYAAAQRQLAAVHKMIVENPMTIAWARTAAEVRANAKRGLLSALFGLEGAHALLPGDEKEMRDHLRALHARGVRYMTLTWSNGNPLGGSSGDASDGQGLTDAGRRMIDEMERLGVVVDLSHVSDPMFWDVIRYVRKPVLASHSSARALTNAPRNMTDAMLRAVAKNGGAVCVNFSATFLDENAAKAWEAATAKIKDVPPAERHRFLVEAGKKLPKVPLSALIDHIDHIAKVAGVDHSCLGSDFDRVFALPVGMEDASKLPAITRELRKRGYSAADVEKILGLNTLRVLEAAEAPPPIAKGPPRIDHILVEVRDLDKAIAFYKDLIGLTLERRDGDFVMMKGANQGVFLWSKRWDWEGPVKPGERPGLGLYPHFEVADVAKLVMTAKQRGYRVVQEPKKWDFGTEAFVADPDGYTWAILGP